MTWDRGHMSDIVSLEHIEQIVALHVVLRTNTHTHETHVHTQLDWYGYISLGNMEPLQEKEN